MRMFDTVSPTLHKHTKTSIINLMNIRYTVLTSSIVAIAELSTLIFVLQFLTSQRYKITLFGKKFFDCYKIKSNSMSFFVISLIFLVVFR